MADKRLLEDGTGFWTLEDNTGYWLLEEVAAETLFNAINPGGDVGPGMCMAGNGGGIVG